MARHYHKYEEVLLRRPVSIKVIRTNHLFVFVDYLQETSCSFSVTFALCFTVDLLSTLLAFNLKQLLTKHVSTGFDFPATVL